MATLDEILRSLRGAPDTQWDPREPVPGPQLPNGGTVGVNLGKIKGGKAGPPGGRGNIKGGGAPAGTGGKKPGPGPGKRNIYNPSPDFKKNLKAWRAGKNLYGGWGDTPDKERAEGLAWAKRLEDLWGDDENRTRKMTPAQRFDRAKWRESHNWAPDQDFSNMQEVDEKGRTKKLPRRYVGGSGYFPEEYNEGGAKPTMQPRGPGDVGWALEQAIGASRSAGRSAPRRSNRGMRAV